MNKLFVALAVAGLATILVFINAYARNDAFDSKGNLFVGDAYSGTIFKYTPDGKKSTFASGVMPLELAFDRSGNLFAADYYSHSIFKFAPDGSKCTFAADLTPESVYYIAVDAADNLFVVDRGSRAIFKFTSDGTKTTFATGDFAGPTFDKAGNLYVWESGSILKFTPMEPEAPLPPQTGSPQTRNGNISRMSLNLGSQVQAQTKWPWTCRTKLVATDLV